MFFVIDHKIHKYHREVLQAVNIHQVEVRIRAEDSKATFLD